VIACAGITHPEPEHSPALPYVAVNPALDAPLGENRDKNTDRLEICADT
jgi:hypothetical protein